MATAPRFRSPSIPAAVQGNPIAGGLYALGEAFERRSTRRERERDQLLEREARAELTRVWNDLDLAPDAGADEVVTAYRAPLEERVEAMRQDNPALAAKVEEWGRTSIATPIARARAADDRKARESVANMQAERMMQIEREYGPATVQALTGETQELRELGAATLIDLREEAGQIWDARDPSLGAAAAGHWEPRLAQTGLEALSAEAVRTGRGNEFLAQWRRGDLRALTAAVDPAAVTSLMDKHARSMATQAQAATAQARAAVAASQAQQAKLEDASLFGLTQTGAGLQRVREDYFSAGGTATGWGDVLKKANSIEENRNKIGDRAHWDSPGVKANEQGLRLAYQGITTSEGVADAKRGLLNLEAQGLISPDFADEGRERLDLISERIKVADSAFEDTFKEQIYDPLVKEVGLTAGGLQLMLNEKAPQAAYLERVLPLIKEVAAEKGMDAGEATAWRQLVSGMWTMHQADTGQTVDATVEDARGWLRNVVAHISREGFAANATDEQLMRIIDASQPDTARMAGNMPGSVAGYTVFSEDGTLEHGTTLLNLKSRVPEPLQRTQIWIEILQEQNIARGLRGMAKVPLPSERAKEHKAMTDMAMPPPPEVQAVLDAPPSQVPHRAGTGATPQRSPWMRERR